MKKRKDLYYFNSEKLQFIKTRKSSRIITAMSFLIGALLLIPIVFQFCNYQSYKFENKQLKKEYLIINKKIQNYTKHLEEVTIVNDSIYRDLLGITNITPYLRNPYYGGTDNYTNLKGFGFSDLMINTHQNIDVALMQINMEKTSYENISKEAVKFKNISNSIPSITPIKIEYLNSLTISPFGMRMHPILNIVRLHAGVDLCAKIGVGVYATGDGIIKKTDIKASGYGKYIVIEHVDGYSTTYAHLSSINVVEGQIIKKGDIIGLVGSTGLSTTPHLHYETRLNGIPINPENFYGDLKGERSLAKSF